MIEMKIRFALIFCVHLQNLASSFILDNTGCAAYPPCYCLVDVSIECSSLNLTDFPKFQPTVVDENFQFLTFMLNSNLLTKIPAKAFRNISVIIDTEISIELYMNYIETIETNAFVGIAEKVIAINLGSNKLTHIPSEVATLTHLADLVLLYNPISTLDFNIVHALGQSLKTLYIDLSHCSSCSDQLGLLYRLKTLEMQYLPLTDLNASVFDGFQDSLKTLTIESSGLKKVPFAICHLRNLTSLYFTHNKNCTVFEPCRDKMVSVKEIHMDDNALIHVPSLFETFPSIRYLSMKLNNISYLQSESNVSFTLLKELILDDNKLTRIPFILNKAVNLGTLSIKNNRIVTIEDPDLSGLSNLDKIYLDNNALVYISPNAFKNNHELTTISLSGTMIHKIPNSIAGLSHLELLNLHQVPIECTCSLDFMNTPILTRTTIIGSCRSMPIDIWHFLNSNLKSCLTTG